MWRKYSHNKTKQGLKSHSDSEEGIPAWVHTEVRPCYLRCFGGGDNSGEKKSTLKIEMMFSPVISKQDPLWPITKPTKTLGTTRKIGHNLVNLEILLP